MSAQIVIQTANYPSAFENPRFSFLAKPPPQRRRAAAPLPPPSGSPPPVPQAQPAGSRSNAILTWATHVQPGSPAPRSPHRRLSITSNSSRRSSISRLNRRPSISLNRAASGSSITHIIDTTPIRTPSTGKFDLTTLGYASVFVQFPKTPTTPSPYLRAYHHKRGDEVPAPMSPKPLTPGPLSAHILASIPISPLPQTSASVAPKRKGMKRFRSLSILRPRSSKTKATAPSPSSPISPTKSTRSTKAAQAARRQQLEAAGTAVAQRKQRKYPASKSVVRAPPTLANELALMQFADGGYIDDHARRVMEAQARAAQGHAAAAAGVADVYRDGQGGMWWDVDEEMEYAPLLGGKTAQEAMRENQDATDDMEMEWEEFDDADTDPVAPLTPFRTHASRFLRTADRNSISTQDSDMDPKNLLPLPENEDPRRAAIDDRVLASQRIGGAGMSVLSLPSRPRRAVPHLQAPASFMLDAAAFGPRSPVVATSVTTTTTTTTSFITGSSTRVQTKKVRRRPAPLKLAGSAHSHSVSTRRRSPMAPPLSATRRAAPLPMPVPVSVLPTPAAAPSPRAKREFLENSFAPVPAPPEVQMTSTAVPPKTPTVPSSILVGVDMICDAVTDRSTKRKGVRGLFAIMRRNE